MKAHKRALFFANRALRREEQDEDARIVTAVCFIGMIVMSIVAVVVAP